MALNHGKRKVKRRALINSSLCPHTPPVPGKDSLHNGQANSGAWELFLRVKPLKDAEQLVVVTHVEPNTIVANEINQFMSNLVTAGLNATVRPSDGELDCIREEVGPYLP